MEAVEENFGSVLESILQPQRSQELLARQTELREELKQSMAAGNSAEVIRLQHELRELPDQIVARQCAEIRARLDTVADELNELVSEEAQLLQIRKARNEHLARLLAPVEEAQRDLAKMDVSLYVLDVTRQELRERRQALRLALQKQIEGIGESNNETFIS